MHDQNDMHNLRTRNKIKTITKIDLIYIICVRACVCVVCLNGRCRCVCQLTTEKKGHANAFVKGHLHNSICIPYFDPKHKNSAQPKTKPPTNDDDVDIFIAKTLSCHDSGPKFIQFLFHLFVRHSLLGFVFPISIGFLGNSSVFVCVSGAHPCLFV